MKSKKILILLLTASIFISATGCNDEVESVNEIDVWTATGTEKLLRDTDYSVRYNNEALEISAFKNEYESAQIMISSSIGKGSYTIETADLTNAKGTVLPKSAFSVYHEKYLNVTEIKDHNTPYSVGYYPDALLPMEKALEYGENKLTGKNQGIWVTVKPDKSQDPGVYSGNFKVKVDGQSFSVPVKVKVFDYTLSDVVHSKSSFSIDNEMLGFGELDTSIEMYEAYYEMLLNYRLSAQHLPGNEIDYVVMEGENLERFLFYADKYTRDDRCSSFNIPFTVFKMTIMKDGKPKPLTSVDFEAFTSTLRSMARYSAENQINLFKKAGTYFIFFDEYDINGMEDEANYNLDKATEVCKTLAEELRDTLTCEDAELLEEILYDLANIKHKVVGSYSKDLTVEEATLVPLINRYNTESGRNLYQNYAEQCYGEEAELWTYTCMNPKTPYPTYHIEDVLISSRLMGWMMYDYNIVGNLYWMVNLYTWREDAWGDLRLEDYYDKALRFPSANGDGFLLYPGRPYGIYGPVASMRLESLRDGNEDYDLMYALEEMYAECGVSAAELGNLTKYLTKNLYSGTMVRIRDSLVSDFTQSREILGALLELADNTGVAVKNIAIEGGVAVVDLVAAAGTEVYSKGEKISPVQVGDYNDYQIRIPMTESVNYLDIRAEKDGKAHSLKFNLGGKNISVNASTLLPCATMVTAGEIAADVIEGMDVMKLSYRLDERMIAELDVSSLGVDDTVNTVVFNIYSFSDHAVDLRILSKCARGSSFAESASVQLQKGWNRVEIQAIQFNCSTNGNLMRLRFNLMQENPAEIAIGNIEIA
ncbi:MAG: DUF4091 domain-containing protein [Clostridia bacterium]|nr:DUF4091 domain-containing protein [Clostridia bacterium]